MENKFIGVTHITKEGEEDRIGLNVKKINWYRKWIPSDNAKGNCVIFYGEKDKLFVIQETREELDSLLNVERQMG